MKQICGIDVGNGYVKAVIDETMDNGENLSTRIDIPSSVAVMTRPNFVPIKSDNTAEVEDEIENIYNRLDASFVTPVVGDSYRRLFGNRALSANASFEEFDVMGNISKANQDLSKTLALGVMAAKALQDYYRVHKSLPTSSIEVEATVSLALPIVEYTRYKSAYAASFKGNVHTVNIHNFENCITVNIRFNNIVVIAEGASAQFAILSHGERLMNGMLNDLKKRDNSDYLNDLTAKDVLDAKNFIGIDIGEGTVNFVVFTDKKFNTDASTTLNKGYGSVLTNALSRMQDDNFSTGFNTRKQLASYIQAGPTKLKKAHFNKVKGYIDEETMFFARDINQRFRQLFALVGATTEVCYVYGGGANAVKDCLYPLLLETVKSAQGEDSVLVLYLDSHYSRNLNREGLFIAANKIEDRIAEKKSPKKEEK